MAIPMITHEPTWQQVMEASLHINIQLQALDFRPDKIIGIARGGLPLATILAHALGVKQVSSIQCSRFENKLAPTGYGMTIDEMHAIEGFHKSGEKWLFVDDIYDSGTTILGLSKLLQERVNSNQVKFATLCIRERRVEDKSEYVIPAYQVPNDTWVRFPWEQDDNCEIPF